MTKNFEEYFQLNSSRRNESHDHRMFLLDRMRNRIEQEKKNGMTRIIGSGIDLIEKENRLYSWMTLEYSD